MSTADGTCTAKAVAPGADGGAPAKSDQCFYTSACHHGRGRPSVLALPAIGALIIALGRRRRAR